MSIQGSVGVGFDPERARLLEPVPRNLAHKGQTLGIRIPKAEPEPQPEKPLTGEELAKLLDSHLSDEDHEKAGLAKHALAEKFSRDIEDFSMIGEINEDGDPRIIVALTATGGIDLGLDGGTADETRGWNYASEPDDPRFIIDINGKKIDTRKDINEQTLRMLAEFNKEICETVWDTNSEEDGRWALKFIIYKGRVTRDWEKANYGLSDMRFRPVIQIK